MQTLLAQKCKRADGCKRARASSCGSEAERHFPASRRLLAAQIRRQPPSPPTPPTPLLPKNCARHRRRRRRLLPLARAPRRCFRSRRSQSGSKPSSKLARVRARGRSLLVAASMRRPLAISAALFSRSSSRLLPHKVGCRPILRSTRSAGRTGARLTRRTRRL